MITLYQFPPAWGLPNASPFCMKVETYLRMTGLAFECKHVMNPRTAPKGKLPYITDGERRVADSGFIVDYLKDAYTDSLDRNLSRGERALGHAIRRMLEEHLYWCLAYDRWVVDRHWDIVEPAFFGNVSQPMRAFLANMVRRDMRKTIQRQGVGRHDIEEVYALGEADLTALSNLLADRPFLLGEYPSSFDATVYAFLANILWVPIPSPLRRYAAAMQNLEPYCVRMRARFYDSDDARRRTA